MRKLPVIRYVHPRQKPCCAILFQESPTPVSVRSTVHLFLPQCTHTYINTHTHKHKHTYTHTNTHTNTHTHKHTLQARDFRQCFLSPSSSTPQCLSGSYSAKNPTQKSHINSDNTNKNKYMYVGPFCSSYHYALHHHHHSLTIT